MPGAAYIRSCRWRQSTSVVPAVKTAPRPLSGTALLYYLHRGAMSNVLSARASRSLGNSCFDSNTYEMDMMCRGDRQRRRPRRGGRAAAAALWSRRQETVVCALASRHLRCRAAPTRPPHGAGHACSASPGAPDLCCCAEAEREGTQHGGNVSAPEPHTSSETVACKHAPGAAPCVAAECAPHVSSPAAQCLMTLAWLVRHQQQPRPGWQSAGRRRAGAASSRPR